MSQIRNFCLYLVLLYVCNSLHIISPQRGRVYYESTILNENFGRQDSDNVNITAPFIIVNFNDLCLEANIAKYANKIVMYRGVQSKFISHVVSRVHCIEKGGGLGAVFITSDYFNQGLIFHYREETPFNNDSSLFLLGVHGNEFANALDDYSKSDNNVNETLTVELRADKNRWVSVWTSNLFFVGWRVIIPILNVIGMIVSSYILTLHFIRIYKGSRNIKGSAKDASYYILLDLSLDLIGFILRFSYAVVGPALSTSKITLVGHLYLINISNPIEVITTLIQTILFVKLGAFGELNPQKVAKIQRRIALIGCLALVFQLILSYLIACGEIDTYYFVAANIILMMIITSVTIVIFILYGVKLIALIGKQGTGAVSTNILDAKQRHKKKAIRWILVGTIFQFMGIISFCIPVYSAFFWTPTGFCLCYFIAFFSFTLNGITNAAAFAPMSQTKIVDNIRKKTELTFRRISMYATGSTRPLGSPNVFFAVEGSNTDSQTKKTTT